MEPPFYAIALYASLATCSLITAILLYEEKLNKLTSNLLFLSFLLVTTTLLVVHKFQLDWELILEYLKVLFSWPVITIAIFSIFIRTFKNPIAEWIKTISDVESELLGQKFKFSAQQNSTPIKPTLDIVEETATVKDEVSQSGGTDEITIPEEIKDVPNIKNLITFTQNNPAEILIELQRTGNRYLYERVFNSIFGSQIQLLEYLNSAPGWHDYSHISGFYASHQSNSKVETGSSFDYLHYLQLHGLIELVWGDEIKTVKATKMASEFIKYLKEMYPNTWNKKAH